MPPFLSVFFFLFLSLSLSPVSLPLSLSLSLSRSLSLSFSTMFSVGAHTESEVQMINEEKCTDLFSVLVMETERHDHTQLKQKELVPGVASKGAP